jgi:hypothetical protein
MNGANGSQLSLNRFAVFNVLCFTAEGSWDCRGMQGKKSGTSTLWKLFREFFHSMEEVIHSVENFFHGVENAFLGA